MFIYLIVAIIFSNALDDEKMLLKYFDAIINPESGKLLLIVIVSIFMVYVVMFLTLEFTSKSTFLHFVAGDTLKETPRLIYFFGASVSGILIASIIFVTTHHQVQAPKWDWWAYLLASFYLSGFLIGFGMNILIETFLSNVPNETNKW